MGPRAFLVVASAAVLFVSARTAAAATIQVGPGDSYDKIEGANPGDEVVIAPGTYAFRVYLTKAGTAAAPIHIHAQDPANPPVWDMGTTLVEDAPGSYTAGDRGRGCWQLSGGTGYVIEGIVFRHCRTSSDNSAGIRYYNGSSVTVRDCVFQDNDDGMTGGTQDSTATVEYCEFDHNGNTAASTSAPTHNLYIYGGTFTLRYSWVHDPAQAQNFHIRAHTALIESNWFARAASYEGDLMTDDDYAGGATFTQSIVLRGNVFLEGTTQSNKGQMFVLYNDTQASGLTLSAHVLFNTFIGDGTHPAFVHLSNADGTPMSAEVDDNVIAGTSQPVLVEDATHGTVTGKNNWLQTGATAGTLTGSVFGTDPGFVSAATEGFHLAPGSGAIGAASIAGVMDLPTTEYWQDEKVTRLQRARATTKDIGAFESTTSSTPQGPYGPEGDAGSPDAGTDATVPEGGGIARPVDSGRILPGRTPTAETTTSRQGTASPAAAAAASPPKLRRAAAWPASPPSFSRSPGAGVAPSRDIPHSRPGPPTCIHGRASPRAISRTWPPARRLL